MCQYHYHYLLLSKEFYFQELCFVPYTPTKKCYFWDDCFLDRWNGYFGDDFFSDSTFKVKVFFDFFLDFFSFYFLDFSSSRL